MNPVAANLGGLSVVVPVYNSEQSLPLLAERLSPQLEALGVPYELILVNDGSRDKSWAVIQELVAKHTWIRGMCHMRNYGQHNALLTGIRAAKHPVIATMDDDLQHPPEELPKLLAKLAEGYDVVYGTPQAFQHSFLRNLASQVTKSVLQGSMGVDVARKISAFRVFRTQIREAFATYNNAYVVLDVMLTWGTSRFAAIEVRHDPRTIGQSNYTLRKLIAHALNMITGFSTLPLQIVTMLGFIFIGFGIVLALYVVLRFLTEGGSVPGFPFLAMTIVTFAGIQLLMLGIMGEYVARIHLRLLGKPTSVVRETAEPPSSRSEDA